MLNWLIVQCWYYTVQVRLRGRKDENAGFLPGVFLRASASPRLSQLVPDLPVVDCETKRHVDVAPSLQLEYDRSRVLPLQAVDRGRTRARLLDDHRGGSDPRSLGGSAGCLGAAAR